MRETELQTSQLFNACHVLFGSEIDVSLDFIHYLQMPGLRAAFRKKALETHPDRSVSLAIEPVDLEKQFKEVNAAYRDLFDYLESPQKFRLVDNVSRKERSGSARGAYQKARGPAKSSHWTYEKQGSFFKKTAPEREFLFGRYLYYHGLISYKQLIDAIIWQKVHRPLLGHLALRWQWLNDDDIMGILRERHLGEKFGECALRCRYLTPYELDLLLGRQRLLQPRIGKYFVEKKILSALAVENMATQLRRHNWKYKSR
jgi:hypothetical protein